MEKLKCSCGEELELRKPIPLGYYIIKELEATGLYVNYYGDLDAYAENEERRGGEFSCFYDFLCRTRWSMLQGFSKCRSVRHDLAIYYALWRITKYKMRSNYGANPRTDKHGRWIISGCWDESRGMCENYGHYFKCSICGEEVKGGYKQCNDKYCRNCGAIMDGDSNGKDNSC